MVDKGFVAQVADVAGGRKAPMNEEQRKEAEKTIKGEFSDVKHVRGILSMGRYSDPDSAQSSFSVLLGDAPHLDHEYAIFGKVTKGDETLRKLEELPTRREGIFVMPTERITILSTYYYDTEMETCQQDNTILKRRLATSAVEIERQLGCEEMSNYSQHQPFVDGQCGPGSIDLLKQPNHTSLRHTHVQITCLRKRFNSFFLKWSKPAYMGGPRLKG
ncbi:hypothetical protein E3N88_31471 [Mikania micrantha]|uniref:PPIase cyclophilin-type domain-containing protein n=1 Tax=Mikania micrantha TaxID=192012 RepID=A0A5N6MRV6_9ASTR|nr:hypothetical protein E3N88_31471 [Mikania micrantha]